MYAYRFHIEHIEDSGSEREVIVIADNFDNANTTVLQSLPPDHNYNAIETRGFQVLMFGNPWPTDSTE